MLITNVVQNGNLLKASLSVTIISNSTPFTTKTSPEFVISGRGVFQVRLSVVQEYKAKANVYNNLLFVKFTKQCASDKRNYVIIFDSVELKIMGKSFTNDDGTWHMIHENKMQQFTFNVAVEMNVVPSQSSFASLHQDTDLTDFELRGDDGSVQMHRAIMAVASPVLRRMMGGALRETAEGHLEAAGTSKATLEHLKKYVYLRTLPESGLEQLLLLSMYYKMPELEQQCVDKLVRRLNERNACDLIEFAAKNNVKSLLLTVLECVQNKVISVTDIRAHLCTNNDHNEENDYDEEHDYDEEDDYDEENE